MRKNSAGAARRVHCFAFAQFDDNECAAAAMACLADYQYDADDHALGTMKLRYAIPDKPHSMPTASRRPVSSASNAMPGPVSGDTVPSARWPRRNAQIPCGPRAALRSGLQPGLAPRQGAVVQSVQSAPTARATAENRRGIALAEQRPPMAMHQRRPPPHFRRQRK